MARGSWVRVLHRIASSDRLSGLIMMFFALLGLLLANIPATTDIFHTVGHIKVGIPSTNIYLPLSHWTQDGLLTLFFLVVGLDLRQELTTGSLSNPKAAAVPMLCAVGGMLVPPILFVTVLHIYSFASQEMQGIAIATGNVFSFEQLAHGWAIPTATDIAFSLAILALFARGLPGSIRAFLMTLATVDDLLAIIVIAVFFSSLNQWYWFIGIAACALAWYVLLRRKKIPWLLVAFVGIMAWVMMFEAGVHPTLAGVLVGLLTPAGQIHGEKSPRAERYKEKLQPFSALLALPLFALFATGVHFQELTLALFISPVVVAVMVALVVGKPLGILLTAWFSTRFTRLEMPRGLFVKDLIPASVACGIGFTVSFLIASLAYAQEELSAEARFGVLLASLTAAIISAFLLSRQSQRMASRLVEEKKTVRTFVPQPVFYEESGGIAAMCSSIFTDSESDRIMQAQQNYDKQWKNSVTIATVAAQPTLPHAMKLHDVMTLHKKRKSQKHTELYKFAEKDGVNKKHPRRKVRNILIKTLKSPFSHKK